MGSGNSTINVANGTGQTATLTFGPLTRVAGATVNYTAGLGQILGGSPKVTFTTAPGTTNSVLKGATTTDATTFAGNTTGFNLATYTTSVVPLTTYSALLATGTVATTNYIVDSVTGSINLTGSESVNALLIVGGFTVSGNSGVILTLGTGTLASTGTGNIVSVPTLALGAAEGVALTNSGASTTISSTITGTDGLTIGDGGTLTLTGANTYNGVNTVQTLTFGATNTGGTFNLTFNGQTTAPITYTTTLATLQANIVAGLAALSTIGSANNLGERDQRDRGDGDLRRRTLGSAAEPDHRPHRCVDGRHEHPHHRHHYPRRHLDHLEQWDTRPGQS